MKFFLDMAHLRRGIVRMMTIYMPNGLEGFVILSLEYSTRIVHSVANES